MATVWVAVAAATLCVVFAVVLTMASVVVARHRAGGAADMAAIAAADHALAGERVACDLAERVARAQGAHIVRCAVRGEIADLVAEVPAARVMSSLPSGVSRTFAPRVRSRAGPPSAGPSHVGLSAPVPESAAPGALRPMARAPGGGTVRAVRPTTPAAPDGIAVAGRSTASTGPAAAAGRKRPADQQPVVVTASRREEVRPSSATR